MWGHLPVQSLMLSEVMLYRQNAYMLYSRSEERAASANAPQRKAAFPLFPQKSPPEDEIQETGRRYPSRDRNTLQRFNFESQDTDPPAKRRRIGGAKVQLSLSAAEVCSGISSHMWQPDLPCRASTGSTQDDQQQCTPD